MSEQKKYITFKDLRAVNRKTETQSDTSTTSTTSTASSASMPLSPASPEQQTQQPLPETKTANRPDAGVAPEKDFQRVPNSITRRAMPEGLFRGKSKQVWDYLWSVSRGAVVPTRAVRKSRREIKSGSGLGSIVTVDAALEHLESVGLIVVKPAIGSPGGNEYEVFTPEETYTTYTSTSSTSSTGNLYQKLDVLDVLVSGITSTTQVVENKGNYPSPKTSFKTNTKNDDDEAFADFARIVQRAARELTGRAIGEAERERLAELAELLVTELKIAAARTTNISSIPAFLTEHLRRRLWKLEQKQLGDEAKPATGSATGIQTAEEARHCPDCGGSGMYYPGGYDKGVARCRHERLEIGTARGESDANGAE